MMRFNERYDRVEFLGFLDDFLPKDFVNKEEDIVINKPRHKEITKAQVLGESKSLGLSVLEVEHTSEHDPRVALATDAFKILADHWIHHALVVFRSKNSDNYRLSYLTISLDLNEKNKAVRKYSNARRYSFYLGPNAKIRTPEQQLIKKGPVKDLDDLLNRFSLEVVNKEFYLQIAAAFDSLVERNSTPNLALPSVSLEEINVYKNFAVRLIGRVMFCWFLKQKSSASGSLISDELLSSQAVDSTEGYYHGILEPLFFEALNTPKDERSIRSTLYDQVPYLNGGLFSPQHDDYYELDRDTFTSRHLNTLRIQDEWFKDFFALLETYNFTIDENTVFDQELSVDPEMLGRIFENLLAEINPETGSSERKRTGSFYTPRQIVEYMVDQSLLSYLVTKTQISEEKLAALISYDQEDDANNPLSEMEKKQVVDAIADLRVLDPACGSGAFPVGMLQKVVYILQNVDADCSMWIEKKLQMVPDLWKQKIQDYYTSHPANYIRKLDVIKGSIFGVDIQPIAVEVSRLRCFLTLVVESNIDDSALNRGIEPLPNLEFKFVCANTLITLPKTQSNGLFDDHAGIEMLSQIMSNYFSASSAKKEEIKLKFTRTQNEILSKTIAAFGQSTGELTQKLTSWDPFGNKSNSWFDPEWMFGIEKYFHIVIGNPPYVSHDKILEKNSLESYLVHSAFADLYCYFYEKSINLAEENGVVTLITSNSFIKADYGLNLRKLLGQNNTVVKILNIEGSQVFESAIVNTAILQVLKTIQHNHRTLITNSAWQADTFEEFVRQVSFSTDSHYLASAIWSLERENIQSLLNKLKNSGPTLEDRRVFIRLGLATGSNEAFLIDRTTRDNFVQEDAKNDEIIKPILRGRDIERYHFDSPEQWIILAKNGVNVREDYPVIYRHLDAFGASFKERGAKGQDWWNLRACSFFEEFKKPKIIWIELSDTNRFTLSTQEDYLLNSAYFLLPPAQIPIEYLLGVLNSSLIKFFLQKIAATSGMGTLRWINAYVKQFPVVEPNDNNSALIEGIGDLVKRILLIKESSALADTFSLESEIDQLVYKLYNLTFEEIGIIEKSTGRSV